VGKRPQDGPVRPARGKLVQERDEGAGPGRLPLRPAVLSTGKGAAMESNVVRSRVDPCG
jgi:hypothetical protein